MNILSLIARVPGAVGSVLKWYQGAGKEILNEIPFVSSLLRDGVRTSEGTLASGIVGLMANEALKALPNPWVLGAQALGLVGVGIYALARGGVKAAVVAAEVESSADEVDPVKGFLSGSN